MKSGKSINTQGDRETTYQQNDNSLKTLGETLGEGFKDYVITYNDMNQIVKKYYKKKGLSINLKFTNDIDNDRTPGAVTTTITLAEDSEFLGVKSKSTQTLSIKDLEKIISELLEAYGKKLIEIKNNVSSSTEIVGSYMDEHYETTIKNKSFTIRVQEKN